MEIRNKKARHLYEILDTYVAGVVLTGTEIKSIRAGKVSLDGSYCTFVPTGIVLRGSDIAHYEHGTHYNHEPKRDRTLLLKAREIYRLRKTVAEKGLTIVALRMFISENGWAKVEIALVRGKKAFDKREDLRRKDDERRMRRN